jgi:hypothetical protein
MDEQDRRVEQARAFRTMKVTSDKMQSSRTVVQRFLSDIKQNTISHLIKLGTLKDRVSGDLEYLVEPYLLHGA